MPADPRPYVTMARVDTPLHTATRRYVQGCAVVGLLVTGALASACAGAPPSERVLPVYSDKTGRLERLDYDSDADGVVDTKTYMEGKRPVRAEIDENNDGTIDRWEYFDAEGRVEKVGMSSRQDGVEDTWMFPESSGEIVRVERSTKRDGTVNRWETLSAGVIAKAEEDGNGDGRIDRWEEYVEGQVRLLALDTSGRGRADRRLVYDGQGQLLRIEADPEGDGRFIVQTDAGQAEHGERTPSRP